MPADWDTRAKKTYLLRKKGDDEVVDAALVLWNGESPGSALMIETGRGGLGDSNVYVRKYREEADQFL